MKLHSDIHTIDSINDALSRAKDSGKVDRLVVFDQLTATGSRTRKNGFEIKLEWLGTKVKGDGRRYTNSGTNGAGTSAYGAFWEEWGWFIDELYSVDPELVFGHYKTRETFDTLTRFKFA